MLIFIENTPRAYAWGSRDALPALLGVAPTGEPQAELWLGDHPGAPASVAKARPAPQTLIDLIGSDPERYGVDGRHLPFLLKVLGIGAPLSLQVHPNKQQAEIGFAREEAAGIPLGARERNYGDDNHKPELLVALSEVSALCGFRSLADAHADLTALARVAPPGLGRETLLKAAAICAPGGRSIGGAARSGFGAGVSHDSGASDTSDASGASDTSGASGAYGASVGAGANGVSANGVSADGDERADEAARSSFLQWVLSGDETVTAGVQAIEAVLRNPHEVATTTQIPARRLCCLVELITAHPGDPGVLISLLLHLVTLQHGEAIYLSARQLHAYLGGIAVEVMAASDNVLRAGFTEKHIDVGEVLRVVDPSQLDSPRIAARAVAPGLVVWAPDVPEFTLLRARLGEPGEAGAFDEPVSSDTQPRAGEVLQHQNSFSVSHSSPFASSFGDSAPFAGNLEDRAESVTISVAYPTVLVVTEGRVRVERVGAELSEVASVGRGQSLYVSAGEDIELTGLAEVFLATVGDSWPRVS